MHLGSAIIGDFPKNIFMSFIFDTFAIFSIKKQYFFKTMYIYSGYGYLKNFSLLKYPF